MYLLTHRKLPNSQQGADDRNIKKVSRFIQHLLQGDHGKAARHKRESEYPRSHDGFCDPFASAAAESPRDKWSEHTAT